MTGCNRRRARQREERRRGASLTRAPDTENAGPGTRGRRRVSGPASFAGTSQIRFGGSVAFATLSARVRSPEAVFGCQPSLAPAGAATRRRRLGGPPGPVDDVVDHRLPADLVVDLVAELRVDAARYAGQAVEHRARRRRNE